MPVKPKDNSRVLRLLSLWLPVLFCMAGIFYFSSLPANEIPALFPLQDILFHAIIYGVLGYLFSRALKNTNPGLGGISIVAITFLFVFSYGISDEFHQRFVPGRDVSVIDCLVDGFAGFIGSLLYK